MDVKGWPTITIFKGKVIWENGEFKGRKKDGKFLKRSLSPALFQDLIA
jgi:dihydropyrimidinase